MPDAIDRRSALRAIGIGAATLGLAACSSHRQQPPVVPPGPPGPVGTQIVYLIRHAEKPTGKDAVKGLDGQGQEDKHSLTPVGWQRAQALAELFSSGQRGIAVPQHLFAARPDSSKRSLETLTPLSAKLHLPINSTIGADEIAAAAAAIARTPGVTLVAWEHHAIAPLVAALGPINPAPPTKWPGSRFDVIWAFTRTGIDWQFSQIPELVLDGDQSTGI